MLGRVEPDATADVGVLALWHALHNDGRVGVHGANLGFRLSAYEAVGGWSPLAEREDLDLVQRLLASGARYGAATRPVTTSSRLVDELTAASPASLQDWSLTHHRQSPRLDPWSDACRPQTHRSRRRFSPEGCPEVDRSIGISRTAAGVAPP